VGSGFRTFTAGEVLTASNVQNYLMDQSVMVFGGSAARSSAIGTANFEEGMVSYLTDTDKVEAYNGTDWVSVAPTTSQGLTLINTTSFSGVISQSINSVFTSTYDNYYIEVDFIVPSGGDVAFRLRSSGTDKTTNYVTKGSQLNAATIGDYGSGTTNLFYLADSGNNLLNLTTLNVSRPAISGPTAMKADTVGNNAVRFVTTGRQTETTTFDGFTVYNVGSNNMNGKIKVFGVNQ
jgi:hypothetical protein